MTHPLAQSVFDTVNSLKGKPNTFASPPELTKNGAQTMCSTFVTLMLNRTYDIAPVHFVAMFGKRWPRARDYYRAFDRLLLGGDTSMTLAMIEPGTVCGIGYDENRDAHSGHCFIVLEAPVSTGDTRGKLNKYLLRVGDSSKSDHGPTDTRWMLKGQTGGIGIGNMALWVNDDGIVKGYSWSMENTSEVLYHGIGQSLAFANIPKDWSLRNG